ncbi:nucleotidyltransferase [Sulfolobales archaeon HS-7]|nr:nucleotidyltransferase [Sulfolobales archaeon HS-7]
MDLSDVKVIIPIGGEATRMKPLTVETSKATVRILNRPLLEFAIIELARQGVKEFIFGVRGYVNYRSLYEAFKEGIGISARYKIKPRLHFKYQPRIDSVGNADSVRINMDYYDIEEPTLVIQGDNLFKLNLGNFLEYHLKNDATMTIMLKSVEDVSEFGVARLTDENRIVEFVEKPRPEQAPSKLANTGIYMLNPAIKEVFKEKDVVKMRKEGHLDFGKDFIPYLIKRDYKVFGFTSEDLWFDVGTPSRYLEAMQTLLRTLPPDDFHGEQLSPEVKVFVQGQSPDSVKRRNYIKRKFKEGEIKLENNVLIGRHCQIGPGTYIADSVIDNFSIVRSNSIIVRSSVMDRVFIGENAYVENSIIGRHCEIRSTRDEPVKIIDSVVADDVIIEEGTTVIRSKIYPHKTVTSHSRIEDTTII